MRKVYILLLVSILVNPVFAQTTVPKWSIHNIALNSTSGASNPYTGLTVTATFTGPGGVTKTVKGFYDGGTTFIVRFCPTVEGTWSYTTSSADAGLNNKSGTINCTAPASTSHGFVRRDASNPYHFINDDGSKHFMLGTTYYGMLQNAMQGSSWKTSVDGCISKGINKARMLIYPYLEFTGFSPYAVTSPFGSSKDQLNIAHWRKLDEVVQYMASKGMVADLMPYFSVSNTTGDDNNFGTQAQDERYNRYIIARYAAYPNVIWCLTNEWNYGVKAQSYWNTLGIIYKNEDPWISQGSNLRALSIHQQTRIDFQFFSQSWPTHAIIQYGVRNGKYINGDEWAYESIRYNWGHNMPVVNDEFGYIGEPDDASAGNITLTRTKHRHILWGTYIAGGYGSTGDKYDYPTTDRPYKSTNWHDPAEYIDVKNLSDFFKTKGIDYWKMATNPALRISGTRVYVLANAGSQYVFYAAVGGTYSINVAAGTYTARRFNPRTGEDIALSNVTGGSTVSFTMPDANDWVVYLKAAGSNPIASFTTNTSSGDAPLDVDFNASNSSDPDGSIASYSWNFGDGATATGVTASHIYTSTGSYTATLTVKDNLGNSSSSSKTINVAATAFSAITYFGNSKNYTPLTPSRWNVSSEGGDNRYFLNTSNYSNLSGERLGEYTIINDRIYSNFTLKLKAKSNEGGSADADYAIVFGYVDENNYCCMIMNAQAIYTQLFKVVSGTRTLIATSTVAGIPDTGYNDAELIRNGNTVIIKLNGSQILSATNTALGISGSVGMGSYNDSAYFDEVDVNTNNNKIPIASFTGSATSGTAPLTVNFNAAASSDPDGIIESYLWDFGDDVLGTGVTVSHTFTTADIYSVSLTVTDANGATDTQVMTVTVNSTVTGSEFPESLENNSHFNLWPNPASGEFNLDLGSELAGGRLTVYNSLGASIFVKHLSGNKNEVLDLSNQKPGLYFLQIVKDNKKVSSAVIKN